MVRGHTDHSRPSRGGAGSLNLARRIPSFPKSGQLTAKDRKSANGTVVIRDGNGKHLAATSSDLRTPYDRFIWSFSHTGTEQQAREKYMAENINFKLLWYILNPWLTGKCIYRPLWNVFKIISRQGCRLKMDKSIGVIWLELKNKSPSRLSLCFLIPSNWAGAIFSPDARHVPVLHLHRMNLHSDQTKFILSWFYATESEFLQT